MSQEKILVLKLKHVHCQDCASDIEERLLRMQGITDVNFLPKSKRIHITLDRQPASSGEILKLIYERGGKAEVEVLDDSAGIREHGEQDSFFKVFKRRLLWTQLLVSAALVVIIAAISVVKIFFPFTGENGLLAVLTVVLMVWTAIPLFRGIAVTDHAVDALTYLSAFALLGMSVYSSFFSNGHVFYFEVSLIYFVLMVGRYLEQRALRRTREFEKSLKSFLPKKTKKFFEDGTSKYIDVRKVEIGDVVQVKSQDRIPFDGMVVEGHSTIDESFLAGESLPKEKGVGSAVLAGSLNQSGTILVQVEKLFDSSLIQDIIQSLARSRQTFSHIQKRLNIISWVLLPLSLLIALGAFFGWYFTDYDFVRSLTIALSVILVMSPFSLRVVTSNVYALSLQKAASRGVLLNRITNIEYLPRVHAALFPYLGIITKGLPIVTDILGGDRFKIIQMAGSLEQVVDNTLGRAVVASALREGVTLSRHVKDYQYEDHQGVVGIVDGRLLQIGSPKFMRDSQVNLGAVEEYISDLEKQGKMVLVLSTKKEALGVLGLVDEKRDAIKETITNLFKIGVKSYLVSSQSESSLSVQSKLLGSHGIITAMDSSTRSEKMRDLRKNKSLVLGVHDESLRETFSAVDLHAVIYPKDLQSDTDSIVFLRPFIRRLPELVRIALFASKLIKQNLLFVLLYHAVVIMVALTGWLRPSMSIVLSLGCVLFVLLNSLRAKNDPKK